MKDLILMGIQGSGKGTQAKMLSKKYGFQILATGDFFRSLRDNDSDLARRVIGIIDRGDYVDDETTMEIVADLMDGLDAAEPILFDGVPRSEPQRLALEKLLDARSREFQVVVIDVPEEVTFERLLKRAELEGREDDTEDGIRSRIDLYFKLTEPLIEMWEDKIVRVDGNRSINEVGESVEAVVEASKVCSSCGK